MRMLGFTKTVESGESAGAMTNVSEYSSETVGLYPGLLVCVLLPPSTKEDELLIRRWHFDGCNLWWGEYWPCNDLKSETVSCGVGSVIWYAIDDRLMQCIATMEVPTWMMLALIVIAVCPVVREWKLQHSTCKADYVPYV